MIHAHAAHEPRAPLTPYAIETGPLRPFEVELAVTHCGICHSDIHLIDDDWQISQYPLVPGHEVVGTVAACGPAVTDVRVGQRVGVGWQSGSCLTCEWCLRGDEMCCAQAEATCVGRPGGFADRLRVDSRFAHPLPDALTSEHAAPLLCAGITVYAPLAADVRPGMRVGIIGIGGLGHLALQFARAMGAEVTAFSTTPEKAAEAERCGARHFVVSSDARQMEQARGTLDYLLSTVTVPLDWPLWLDLLRHRGTLTLVGASPGTVSVSPMALIVGQKAIRGSAIGGRAAMRAMLAFAARTGVRPQVEVVPLREVNAALAKVRANQARYRIVLAA